MTVLYSDSIVDYSSGYKRVITPASVIATDGDDQWARCAKQLASLLKHRRESCSIALIGGGLGIFPQLLGAGWVADVYEIVPSLIEYCPAPHGFIEGDWRVTLTSQYDAIVYDIDDDPPLATLITHLNPGGILVYSQGTVEAPHAHTP